MICKAGATLLAKMVKKNNIGNPNIGKKHIQKSEKGSSKNP